MEDIGILTAGQPLFESLGKKLENVTLAELGRAKKIVIDKDNTTIIEGAGKSAEIKGRIEQLRREIENTTSDYDREKLEERLAKLAGGVAKINVGAATETRDEGAEGAGRGRPARHPRGRRGRHSARRRRGPVAGLAPRSSPRGSIRTARSATRSCSAPAAAPLTQIAANAGQDGGIVCEKVAEGKGAFGYNALTNKYEDLVKAGVIDPTKVTRTALQNASSVATLMLTSDALVADKPKKDKAPAMPQGGDEDMY